MAHFTPGSLPCSIVSDAGSVATVGEFFSRSARGAYNQQYCRNHRQSCRNIKWNPCTVELPQLSGEQTGCQRGHARHEEIHTQSAPPNVLPNRLDNQGLQHWLRQGVVQAIDGHRDPYGELGGSASKNVINPAENQIPGRSDPSPREMVAEPTCRPRSEGVGDMEDEAQQ